MSGSAQQWLRACSLVIADETGNGVELAGSDLNNTLRIKFTVISVTISSPATMHARVYNLAPATLQNIQSLASKNAPTSAGVPFASTAKVVLKAGYQANLSTLFTGQIYQLRVGKETNVDSYMDIFAGDGDLARNFSMVNKTLAKGYTPTDVWDAAGSSMQPWQVTAAQAPDGVTTTPSPRGRVVYGMARDTLDTLGRSYGFDWNITDGQLSGLPKAQTKPGDAIVINSFTGQIGVPEQTEEGITVVCLLNPSIRAGARIQLTNNAEISKLVRSQPGLTNQTGNIGSTVGLSGSQVVVPPLNSDGIYKVLQCSHVGDTRGNEWYTRLICLSVDPSAIAPGGSVKVPIPS